MQEECSCKCLASEVTAMALIKNMLYRVAGGEGSSFLGNTLEEEQSENLFPFDHNSVNHL